LSVLPVKGPGFRARPGAGSHPLPTILAPQHLERASLFLSRDRIDDRLPALTELATDREGTQVAVVAAVRDLSLPSTGGQFRRARLSRFWIYIQPPARAAISAVACTSHCWIAVRGAAIDRRFCEKFPRDRQSAARIQEVTEAARPTRLRFASGRASGDGSTTLVRPCEPRRRPGTSGLRLPPDAIAFLGVATA
jgi:hypothetical protein